MGQGDPQRRHQGGVKRQVVARMERSDIRERPRISLALNAGYETGPFGVTNTLPPRR